MFFLQGATVVDFAYHVHTDVGNHMIGAKVNGKYVMASHQLANAEIIDILTYDGPLTKNLVARHQVRAALFTAFAASCTYRQGFPQVLWRGEEAFLHTLPSQAPHLPAPLCYSFAVSSLPCLLDWSVYFAIAHVSCLFGMATQHQHLSLEPLLFQNNS